MITPGADGICPGGFVLWGDNEQTSVSFHFDLLCRQLLRPVLFPQSGLFDLTGGIAGNFRENDLLRAFVTGKLSAKLLNQ